MELELLGLSIGLLVASLLFGDLLRRVAVRKGWPAGGAFWAAFITYNLIGYLCIFVEIPEITIVMIVIAIFYLFIGKGTSGLQRSKRSKSTSSTSSPSPRAIFNSNDKRVEAASEVVSVPQGVTIRVKRARTIQHTITITRSVSAELSGNANVMELINLAIRTEMTHSRETGYQESETIEYEVELNGNTSKGYKLIWTDIWKQGQVLIDQNTKQFSIPFEYHERSELNVVPIAE